MKILVIGSGGREHALAWKLAQSPKVTQVFVAPGNGGTATEDGLVNVSLAAIPSLVEFARREDDIAFTVVGPEAPLAAGVVDAFRAAGLKIFGPSAAAAQFESSKDFAKQFMARHVAYASDLVLASPSATASYWRAPIDTFNDSALDVAFTVMMLLFVITSFPAPPSIPVERAVEVVGVAKVPMPTTVNKTPSELVLAFEEALSVELFVIWSSPSPVSTPVAVASEVAPALTSVGSATSIPPDRRTLDTSVEASE